MTANSNHVCNCTCDRSGYVQSRAELSLWREGKEIGTGHLGDLAFVEEPIRLRARDPLVLTKEVNNTQAKSGNVPHISCTLPEVFSTAVAGQPIFFDDGKIEGCIREVHPDHILVEVLHTGGTEARLGSGKGINLPETELGIAAMTAKDKHDLDFVAEHADIVEVGFERLAEVQEEILWLSEAAHMPVVWATQVLETLAKTGTPSRSEVTDAAMGVRAECVMLNKGEYILDAVRFLDHVLHRMQAHHLKKRSMMRSLAVAHVSQAGQANRRQATSCHERRGLPLPDL